MIELINQLAGAEGKNMVVRFKTINGGAEPRTVRVRAADQAGLAHLHPVNALLAFTPWHMIYGVEDI